MTGIIILAAGASTRLGRAKQTLQYKNQSLLKSAMNAAVKAAAGLVIVVTGANEKEILDEIKNEPVIAVANENWKQGMASSIHAGVTALLQHHPHAQNLILMVCDQAYVDEKLLQNLINTNLQTGKPIVACAYNGTTGVPSLFDKKFFDELLSLKGEEGGKKILLKHAHSVASVPFEAGAVDIDTVTDYEALKD